MSKRFHFMTLYGASSSGTYTPIPHSAREGEEPNLPQSNYGGSPFVFDVAAAPQAQDYEDLLEGQSGLSLLAAAQKLVEIVEERTIILKVPVDVGGPFLTDIGEVAVRFILGEVPQKESQPADKPATIPAGEGEARKPEPKPKEPTPQEQLDAFINQLASQSKALTGKEFRLDQRMGLLFVSTEKLRAVYRAQQKTWGGLDKILNLLGIDSNVGSSSVIERAALSIILDLPDLDAQDQFEFEFIIGTLEKDGGGAGAELRRAFDEMSLAYSQVRSLPTNIEVLLGRFGLDKASTEFKAFVKQKSALTQLALQLMLIYNKRGVDISINMRLTAFINKMAEAGRELGEKNPEGAFGKEIKDSAFTRLAYMSHHEFLREEDTDASLEFQLASHLSKRKAIGDVFDGDNYGPGLYAVLDALSDPGFIEIPGLKGLRQVEVAKASTKVFALILDREMKSIREEMRLREDGSKGQK